MNCSMLNLVLFIPKMFCLHLAISSFLPFISFYKRGMEWRPFVIVKSINGMKIGKHTSQYVLHSCLFLVSYCCITPFLQNCFSILIFCFMITIMNHKFILVMSLLRFNVVITMAW